jgi:hypothetical protein
MPQANADGSRYPDDQLTSPSGTSIILRSTGRRTPDDTKSGLAAAQPQGSFALADLDGLGDLARVRQNKDQRCDRRIQHSGALHGSRVTHYSWRSPLERVASASAVQCPLQQLRLTTMNRLLTDTSIFVCS